ncbi:arylsulfatase, partial [Wenyingzhuangia sp. 2_MG-2023]|nr:arylsulfatase [Wenyingzhuangia sp. 2_MG-2023]
ATIHHTKEGVFVIRKEEWKLIVAPNSGLNAAGRPVKFDENLPEYILYNLKTDIGEHINVAESHPEKVKELKQLLIKQI